MTLYGQGMVPWDVLTEGPLVDMSRFPVAERALFASRQARLGSLVTFRRYGDSYDRGRLAVVVEVDVGPVRTGYLLAYGGKERFHWRYRGEFDVWVT